jgi:hypothetical protein
MEIIYLMRIKTRFETACLKDLFTKEGDSLKNYAEQAVYTSSYTNSEKLNCSAHASTTFQNSLCCLLATNYAKRP